MWVIRCLTEAIIYWRRDCLWNDTIRKTEDNTYNWNQWLWTQFDPFQQYWEERLLKAPQIFLLHFRDWNWKIVFWLIVFSYVMLSNFVFEFYVVFSFSFMSKWLKRHLAVELMVLKMAIFFIFGLNNILLWTPIHF